jgi:hypothetical protein
MNFLYLLVLGGSAAVVSLTGAAFSIAGLTKLFAGAPIAVGIMAGALELCKMMAASFLHRNWRQLHFIMKVYMTLAVGILMCITSMGIFGYLSFAFQHTQKELKNSLVRIESLETEEKNIKLEMERLQKSLDEIPGSRITKKMEAQKAIEPRMQELQRQSMEVQIKLRNENISKLSFQMEIGPVIYVAELLNAPSDNVATYLILLFVIVFDPLAVSMVLATSFAIHQREEAARMAAKAAMPSQSTPLSKVA